MEGNVLKIHREYPSSNSRRLREAIALVLFDIKEKYTGGKSDTDKFRNEDSERLEKALLMAFDPYTNREIMVPVRVHTADDCWKHKTESEFYPNPCEAHTVEKTEDKKIQQYNIKTKTAIFLCRTSGFLCTLG